VQTLHRHSGLVAVSAISVASAAILGLAGWPVPHRASEFAGLVVAAIVMAIFGKQPPMAGAGIMPPAFVINFTSLLFLGPDATMVVAVAGSIAAWLIEPEVSRSRVRLVLNAVTVGAATKAAGEAHLALGGTLGHFNWPWQALPVAAAIAVYFVMVNAAAALALPLLERRPIDRACVRQLPWGLPNYVIAAAISVGLVELIDGQMWQVGVVAALPLYFAHRAYADYLGRLDDDRRRREVIDSLQQGMSVVDHDGCVTLWSDALERLVGCSPERALGRPLFEAVPALSRTELPRTISESLTTRSSRTIASLAIGTSTAPRILQVTILPVDGGATLLWHDVTERRREESALRRSEERLALAAEGANDGLWEWDLRTHEFYTSGRWRAMVGLPTPAAIGQPEEWLDRVHPDDATALKVALDEHLTGATDYLQHEHRVRHEDGSYRWFVCRGVAVRGAGRRPMRIAGSLTDTTERAIAHARLRTAGFTDPLTGLSNRAVFVEGLGRRLDEFKQRRAPGRFAVLYLDLDRFKVINDSLGHLVGDELLIGVSRRLESCLREGDSLARLGGDEFAVLLNRLGDEQQVNAIAFRIQEVLSAPISIGGREVFTSASIGIAFGVSQYNTPDEIMRDADTAMYHAKSRGKARHELFDADMHARTRDRLGLENDLRHAVTANDFEVHYQPIVLLASGMCVGFESLVRWTRNGEPISPATFIPIAEELGLIEPLGTWVMQEACRTFADWRRRFPDSGLECITINASSRQLMQQNFVNLVEQAVTGSGLRPSEVRIEITETALMDSPNAAADVLRELRNFGVKIYLDDFGTGYSSLSHLHNLPVDTLKIDRSFVKSLLLPDRPAIVESIVALARTLNTSLVAEGIESDVQARELERLGCTHAQGYLFSRPIPAQAVEALLLANQPLGPKQQRPLPASATRSELYYSSKPIVWPDQQLSA
jgi:diguanylate cyclase (GGDEF)-like protein/PAS domain S-box-containing protein